VEGCAQALAARGASKAAMNPRTPETDASLGALALPLVEIRRPPRKKPLPQGLATYRVTEAAKDF